jgi:hypothetical protein
MWETRRLSAFWANLRGAEPAQMLLAFGRFAVGQDAWLAGRNLALVDSDPASGSEIPVLAADGRPVAVVQRLAPDRGLAALGLQMVLTAPPGAEASSATIHSLTETGAIILRAGLMMRCLSLAFAHLEGRESGGQPTLQLPLVKATFTECATLADRLQREAVKHLEGRPGFDLSATHEALSSATARAAKLMGGHGFLAGQLNALETLSLLIASGFGPLVSARSVA